MSSDSENQDRKDTDRTPNTGHSLTNLLLDRSADALFSSSPVFDLALGIRTNSWGQHLAGYSNHRYGAHGGAVRFFIEGHRRPKLVYVSSLPRVVELRFRNEKGQVTKKNINFLTLSVGNEGKSDAAEPKVGVVLYPPPKPEKTKWLPAVSVNLEFGGNLKFREVLVKTDSEPSEEQLAYALVTDGLKRIDTLMSEGASLLVLAFAFQDSQNFYFGSDDITCFPFVGTLKVALTGHAKGVPTVALSYDYSFVLSVHAWNDMSLLTTEEDLYTEPLSVRFRRFFKGTGAKKS